MSNLYRKEISRNYKQDSRLISQNIFKAVIIPYTFVIASLALMLSLKQFGYQLAIGVGLFIAGFKGILKIFIYRQSQLSMSYTQGRFIGDILYVISCWGIALLVVV